jgi:hypothetical protein
MNKYFFVFVFLTTLSCNEPDKRVNEAVNKTIDDASAELQTENDKLKDSLFLWYQNLLKSSSDTVLKSKAVFLFEKVSKTDSFIDSLQTVIKHLNRDDVENVKTIKEILAEGSLGDSLKHCLNSTFLQARDFSVNQEQKTAIDSLKTNMFYSMRTGKSWQEELFGMTNPLGASLILFGLQKELYNVGKIAFKQ